MVDFRKHLSRSTTMSPAPSPFGKPKAAASDGAFEFQLPSDFGSSRKKIPAGHYIGRLTDVIQDVSKESHNDMWVWTFVITQGPHAGRDFKLWTVLTDEAAWKLAEVLEALGVEAKPGAKLAFKKRDLIGTGVTMYVVDDGGKNNEKAPDGTPKYSKLDSISGHPKGVGYKPRAVGTPATAAKPAARPEPEDETDDRDYPPEFDEGTRYDNEEGDEEVAQLGGYSQEEEEAEEQPPQRPVRAAAQRANGSDRGHDRGAPPPRTAPPRRATAEVETTPNRGKAAATLGKGGTKKR